MSVLGTYVGPRSYQIPGLLDRQRWYFEDCLKAARMWRRLGNSAGHQQALERAAFARKQIAYLKACERACTQKN